MVGVLSDRNESVFLCSAFREVPLAEGSVLGTVQLAFDSEVNGPSTQPTVDQKCMNFMAEHDHKDKAAHSMFRFSFWCS